MPLAGPVRLLQLPGDTGSILASVLERYSPIGMGGGSLSVVPPVSGARKNGRGVRPAGGDRRSPPKVEDGQWM